MKGKIDIYKASAGSGKTFRLAGEYIKMLFSDEYEYRHILAVTFTNKATDQMKHRILSELYLLSKHPDKSAYIDEIISYTHKSAAQVAEYAGSVLKRILHDYSAFNISTIDTFFQSVMRSFSRELGRMATYNVEIDDRQIISMVIDRMFLSLERSENSRLLDWLIKYSLENIEEGRSWRIKNNILDLSKNLNSESFKIKNRGKSGYSNPECYMEQIQRLKERIADVERSYEEDIKDLAGQAIRIIEGGDLTLPDFKWGSRSPFARFWKFADGSAVFDTTSYTVLSRMHGNVDEWVKKEDKESREKVLDISVELDDVIAEMMQCYRENYRLYATCGKVKKNLSALAILGEVHSNLTLYCRENNILLLSQTNELLHDIIDGSDTPFIYEKVGTWINHFMIDEFQDTSSMQWENFKPLLHNSIAEGNGNLVVGDVKQSIYRWRNSDWNILNSGIMQEFRCNVNTLSVNWRSSKDLVEFNNGFFGYAAWMLEDFYCDSTGTDVDTISGIYNYDVPLARHRDKEYADQTVSEKGAKTPGYVELNFTSDKQMSGEVNSAILLSTVGRLVDNGYPRNSICVLVRSNTDAQAAARVLADAGYQVSSAEAFTLSLSDAVLEVVSHLETLDEGNQPEEDEKLGTLPLYSLCEVLIREKLTAGQKEDLLFLQSFLDTVLEFSVKNGDNRTAFLKWWHDSGYKTNVQLSQERDAINVMTIHKSKGLEFEAVIIPYFTLLLEPKGWNLPLLWSDVASEALDFDGVLSAVYSSKLRDTLFEKEYLDERLNGFVDNLNLAYVAFTRAKRELVVIADGVDTRNIEKIASPVGISNLLYGYATATMADSLCEGDFVQTFSSGAPACYLKEERDICPEMPLQLPVQFSAAPALKRFGTALQSNNSGDGSDIRNMGIVMHEYFSEIENAGDVENIADPRMRELIAGKLAFAEKYGWFSKEYKVYRECEIIAADGSVHRPDRVVVKEGEAVVIDYKFGEYRPCDSRYVRQVKSYMRLLSGMGFSKVRGALWYVGQDMVEEF